MYCERTARSAFGLLALALPVLVVPAAAVAQGGTCGATSLTAGFNGTPIPVGTYLWFNNVLKPKFPAGTSDPVTIRLDNASLVVTPKGGVLCRCPVPNAQITYTPAFVPPATMTYDAGTNTYSTVVPASFRDNVFVTGLAIPTGPNTPFPNGLAGGATVTFSATFSTDTPGVTLQYQFAAAVYRQFSTDYNALGIKPTHGGPDSYPGGDQAGTPENFAFSGNCIGGATGGGGSNFTGSYSATVSVVPCPFLPVVGGTPS